MAYSTGVKSYYHPDAGICTCGGRCVVGWCLDNIAPEKRMFTTIQKWATFTYVGKETTFIINLFKKTDLGIALRTNNTIQRLLMQRQQTSDKYAQSGVYSTN
jgi:hypothetical protein